MCGVPVHTAEAYLARLIRAGYKVALCEQTEGPRPRRAGAAIKGPGAACGGAAGHRRHADRGQASSMPAGTIILPASPTPRGRWGSPGSICRFSAFLVSSTGEATLAGDLARIAPGEILLPERLLARPALFELFADWKPALTPLANARFDRDAARRRLESFYGVKALDGFGAFRRAEIAAAGTLVDYVTLTQRPAADEGGALHLGAADPGGPGLGDADRCRDPAQPRAAADAGRRAARQPPVGRRPHRDRRRLPLAGRPPRGALDRARGDRRAARRGAVLCRAK